MSSHPTDRLIGDLLQTHRIATDEEVLAIVQRLAAAPFDPREVAVPAHVQGVTYLGRTLGTRTPSLFLHLVQRVVEDREWAAGTTEQAYLQDLRHAVRQTDARVVLYHRRGGNLAAVLAPNTLPGERRGRDWKPRILVLHSADWGMLVTGYQVARVPRGGIPENALWLR